jgi:rhamnosyltransferase
LKKVIAVVVSYQPNFDQLLRLLNVISKHTEKVVVVDNNSATNVCHWLTHAASLSNVHCLSLSENFGVAKAQNTGIAWAQEQGANYVLLFDQDSEPAPDMVSQLLSAMNKKQNEGYNTAAVGAKYSDIKGQHISPFVKLKGFRLHRIKCNDNEIVAVDHLISSGCLISMDALAKIGAMEDQLFIDYVDTEWCLRAIHKGYCIFGVGSAHMQHSLGDGFINLFGRTVPIHSPLRYYYLIRNGIWLLRQPWISNSWRVMDIKRLFLIYIAYSLFNEPRFKNWKMMTLGIWHGLKGKIGKLSCDCYHDNLS